MKKAEGLTEELNAKDKIALAGAMESIHNRVTEIVTNELIYI